ncbi:MAG: 3-deoxy-D-manno-octulosonic acid transferase [Pseudomonadota bacterium]
MSLSPGLALYLAVTDRLEHFADRKLAQRIELGKEDPGRIDERRGISSTPRPDGILLWFHAASVGESLSLLNLIEQLQDDFPQVNALITTGTRSSAELLQARLPPQTIHQFVPLDVPRFVRRFLNHWQPDIAIWTESEFWPSLITLTQKHGTKMFLLNARMSMASHQNWRWLPGVSRAILRSFGKIYVQDEQTAFRLRRLGAARDRVKITGSLKAASGALPHDEEERQRLADTLKTRPVWLAASTHPGEEEDAAEAHRLALKTSHRLLLIIAPRHPERAPEIAAKLRDDGWNICLRSEGRDPDPATQIFLADTMGEMGLWYRLAPITFLGGSLAEIGGHNPYEPAALGSAILHGPHVESARNIFSRLDEATGARLVRNATELGEQVVDLLEPDKAARLAHAAWEVTSSGAGATDRAYEHIADLIDAVEMGK